MPEDKANIQPIAPPRTNGRHLRERVRAGARDRPGVYRFTGPRGEVLYVGKSVRVRSRLLSYFRAELGTRQAELVRSASGVEWEYVPNEFEALLRELRLIRSFRPRFNVRHRRERRFAWIRITPGPAPRLVATRRPRPDGSRYFGPFPAGRRLPRDLREVAYAVGMRDCPDSTPILFADQLDLLEPSRTPACLRGDLGTCPAPCAGRCTADEYRAGVVEAEAFLGGADDEPLRRLEARLREAAEAREYERAARLRDRLERVRDVRDRVRTYSRYLERLHFVYEPVGAGGTPGRRYLVLRGIVRLTLDHHGAGVAPGDADRIREILARPDRGPTSLTAGEREELFLVARWFRQRPEELDRTVPVASMLGAEAAGGFLRKRAPSTERSRTPSS